MVRFVRAGCVTTALAGLVIACGDGGAAADAGSTAADTSAGGVTSSGGSTIEGPPTGGSPTSEPSTGGDPTGVVTTGPVLGDMPVEPPATLFVAVLSSRPDMVTGGDALVEVRFAADVAGDAIAVHSGDQDVTAAFQVVDGTRLVGVVEGLALGDTVIEASAPGQPPAQLVVTNYPIQGPMISGPHQAPFVCQTQAAGLGAPLDGDCSVETRYEYFYKNTLGQFAVLVDPSQVPADVAQVASEAGMIDYIVRVERGTINRAIYQITTLFDPSAPTWTATAPQPQWTGKVLYGFRGGCGVGRHQGVLGPADDLASAAYPLVDIPVSLGTAVLSASLNTLGTNCNDVLTAETAMMVKERFIERYGVPLYTMGWGGSGGSIQQHTMAENYPGVLDGIVPMISYPDIVSVYPDIMDCPLLIYYFLVNAQGMYADVADQAAVSGFASDQTCVSWFNSFGLFEDPSKGCDASIPAEQIYHPVNNPGGIRCTFVDNIINLLGTDPETGFARDVYDNVGVQYGLAALNEGAISKEQFLHLNEHVGGYDLDGGPQPARAAADPLALRAAYEGGRVVHGDLGLDRVPILDLRFYTDLTGDIHDRIRTFSTRDRLVRANGHADNHAAIITTVDAAGAVSYAAWTLMDTWLTALAASDEPDLATAVVATRPPELVDLCVLGPNMDPLASGCEVELPVHRTPRMIAGAQRVNDTLKCTLRPIDLDDYAVTFTDAEQARLAAAFPDGVCDWEIAGVEQVPALGTWQSFGPKP